MPRFSIINYKLFYEDINQDIFKYFKNEEKLNAALRITLILFFWNHLIVFSTLPAQSLYIPIRTIKFLFWKKMVLVFISWKKCFYKEFWQIRRKEFDLVLLTVIPRFVTLLTFGKLNQYNQFKWWYNWQRPHGVTLSWWRPSAFIFF